VKQIAPFFPLHSKLGKLLVCILASLAMLLPGAGQLAQAAPISGASGGLEVEYANYNPSPSAPLAQPAFQIMNNTSNSIALSNLTIRYWYTEDGTETQQFWCDYAVIGCGNVSGSFNSLSPATSTADTYLQVSFTSGILAAGASTGPIETRFNKSDYTMFNQTNDYSWNSSVTSWQPYGNVGLYDNGQLVWGTEPGTAATASVNTASSLGQVPSTAIGVNDAVWDGNLLDSNLPGLLSSAGVEMMRYPGGSTADVYHWQSNSVVPNQSYANPNNTFDAFMSQVQAVGAQPIITVNYGSGTPQEAANWVQYANKGGANYTGPVPSYPGGSATGHTYGIKYWEIGNEIYGNGTYGADWEYDLNGLGPATYANNVVLYSQAMKAVDPSIKIGLVLTAPGNWPDAQTSASSPQPWNNTVLPIACSSIDFVIAHWYAQGPGGESDAGLLNAPEDGESTSVSYTPSIPSMVATLRSEINQYCGARASSIQIMITETNSVSYNTGKQTVSLVNGLFMDDDYMTWLENGVANVDWWDVHNSASGGNNNSASLYGNAQYGDYGILSNGSCASATICEPPAETPFPTYYTLQMLSYLAHAGDTMVSSSSSNSLLAIHAVKQANGQLAIMIINKDPNTTYNLTLSLGSFNASGIATVYRYGENSTAISTSAQPVSGSTVTVSVEPYSTNTIVLP
jgi:hypothetical protein